MAWIQPAFQDNENTKTSLSNPPPLARAHHTLTWLPGSLNDLESKDSRRKCAVLIGGANRETLLADTHVLSHQDGQWKWEELHVTPSGSRNALTPRARHSAVAIQGKIFVFGGIGGGEAVFSLDVEAKRWLRLKTTGRGPCARFAHAATSVQSIMYIIGGHTGTCFVNDVFCLETLTRRWSQIHIQSSVRLPPSLHWTACTVMGSKIMVFGGALGTPLENAYVLRQPDRVLAESNERSLKNMSLFAQSSRSSFALAMQAASQRNFYRGLEDDRACQWVRLPLACKETKWPRIGCDHSVFSRETPTGQQIVYFAGTSPLVAHNEAAPGARLREADHPIEKAMSIMWTFDLPIDATNKQTLLWEMHYLAGEPPPARVGTRCVLISEHVPSGPALLFFGGTRTNLPFDISSRVPRSFLSSSSRQDPLTNLTHICDLAAFVPCKQLHAASKPPAARSGHSFIWVGPDPNNPHLECALLLGGDSCASGKNTVCWDAHLLAFNHKTKSWTWQFPLIDFPQGKIPQAKHPKPRHTPSLIMQQQENITSTRARSVQDDERGTSREIPPPFTAHSATLFATPFPKLFVFGGGDLLTTSSELWILHMNAQYWSWEKGTPCLEKKPRALNDTLATLDWPGARAGHAACRHHGKLYVIGGACPNADRSSPNRGFMGQSDNQLLLNDIWTLDVDTRLATATSGDRHLFQQLQWTNISHAAKDGVFFQPRFGHSCTSVPLIDSLVVFGGCVKAHHPDSTMLLVNDLVAFHTEQQKWVRLGANESAGRPPSPRYQHSCTLTFDANAASASSVRLCIMGGFGYTSQSSFDNVSAVDESRMRVPGPLKDIFIFDVRLRTWSEAKIAGEALPPLWRHAVFSRASQPSELVVFGGTRRKKDQNENEFPPAFEDCNEIWRLDSTWESPTQALLSM